MSEIIDCVILNYESQWYFMSWSLKLNLVKEKNIQTYFYSAIKQKFILIAIAETDHQNSR